MIEGNAAALEQLFVNLLVNAVHALSHGGAAHVLLELVNGSACVTVADDGSGMTTEQMESIESPFFSTKRDGVGLGLAIARRIATAHGGTPVMQSSAPGKGTQVLVRLPLAVLD